MGADGYVWIATSSDSVQANPYVYRSASSPEAACRAILDWESRPNWVWKFVALDSGTNPPSSPRAYGCISTIVTPTYSYPPYDYGNAGVTLECAPGYRGYPPTDPCQPINSAAVRANPIADPVIPGSQITILTERDVAGNTELPVDRFYRSSVLFGPQISLGQWVFGWQRELDVGASTSRGRISALRDDGTVFVFQLSSGAWTAVGTQDTLQPVSDAAGNVTGWQYTTVDTGVVENYAADGKLQSVRERSGRTTTLTYNAARQLTSVTAPSGRSLVFGYDNQSRVASVVTADGATTQYAYNAAGMLSTVTYPDGTTRRYVYEDSHLPTALTGVIDENGGRYVTYAYDASGHAISSSLGNGVNHYQFQYGSGNYTNVTDPTGKVRAYNFLRQNGELLLTSVTAPCAACGITRQSSKYDTNNNLIRETDYLGNVTTHAYDSQKRETQRVEGSGAPNARTTSTQWHPQFWNLRTQVASPTKLERYSYDANGNLVSYSETPTSDTNGSQGFNAVATGPARTTTWTYTADGQVATSKGPRTDVNDGTTYVYRTADDTNSPPQYRKGDLYQVVDALGHTSTINQYDPNGRRLQMTDANGSIITFVYSNRGWLIRQTVTPSGGAGQTTSYEYDKVGQLTKVTQPDGGTVSFSYDGAHRLVGAGDSAGNSITYRLDAMGNRVQEQSKDPSGNLARQITRVFDSMNRPLKVTVGATQ
ncbi:RHS repeat protein [Ralstonia sp. R-29]|uniref:hypothetical protein n=1 Tax=Ralstonia sp. R-29 TaxID=3404059 RepID=UPI003CF91E4B